MTMRPLLSRRDDAHAVVFHVTLMAAYAVAFWLYLNPEATGIRGVPSRLAFVMGAAIMLGWCSGVNVGVNFHNHVHRPIFRSRAVNLWFERFWTVSGGWPAAYWRHAHLVHHATLLSDDDWTLPRRRADGSWESAWRYAITTWPFRYGPALRDDFRKQPRESEYVRGFRKEGAFFLVLFSLPFWIDPWMALGLWLLPAWLANAAVMGPGMYAQHAGCERPTAERPYAHSNTFVNGFFNLTMFEIGYHIEHHRHPQVHWSALPALHRRLRRELIAGGGHVVPFGYYRGGQLLSSYLAPDRGRRVFGEQHEAYRYGASASAPRPEPDRSGAGSPEGHAADVRSAASLSYP